MESHNRQKPAGGESTLGGLKATIQFAIFIVHRDTQALKSACRGVGLVRFGARQAGFHDLGKRERRCDRSLCAGAHNGAGDAAAGAFFAVVKDDIGQLGLIRRIDEIGRRWAVLRHAHIKGTITQEGKAALGKVKLHRAYTEIEHNAVKASGIVIHTGEHAFDQFDPVAVILDPVCGHFKGQRITVDADHLVGARFEKTFCVAPCPEGAIKPCTLHRRDRLKKRRKKDGNMWCGYGGVLPM